MRKMNLESLYGELLAARQPELRDDRLERILDQVRADLGRHTLGWNRPGAGANFEKTALGWADDYENLLEYVAD